jgi:hypothetical protein
MVESPLPNDGKLSLTYLIDSWLNDDAKRKHFNKKSQNFFMKLRQY